MKNSEISFSISRVYLTLCAQHDLIRAIYADDLSGEEIEERLKASERYLKEIRSALGIE